MLTNIELLISPSHPNVSLTKNSNRDQMKMKSIQISKKANLTCQIVFLVHCWTDVGAFHLNKVSSPMNN